MSRLFSRLENIGQGRSDDAPSPAHPAPDPQPETAAPPASFVQAGAVPLPSGAPTIPQLVPAYSISANLSMAPPAPVASTRPDWGVRLWLFSLLLLIALALLMLALPERMYPISLQRQTPVDAQPSTAPIASVPEPAPAPAPAASIPASPPAVQPVPAEPAPAPAPTPRAARPEPRTTAPPVFRAPARPASPGSGAAACSDAMLALNLCSPSSP